MDIIIIARVQYINQCMYTFSSVYNLLVFIVAVNEAGDTPLSLECSRGDLEMFKALINKHVDPESKCLSLSSVEPVNKAGDTPLSLACANGHLDTVKYLVNEHHCDPITSKYHCTYVHVYHTNYSFSTCMHACGNVVVYLML